MRLAKGTRTQYLRDIDAWIAFAGPDPAGWTRYRAQEFYGDLLTHMKAQSANRVLAAVAHASSWWAKKENRPELHFAVVQMAKDDEVEPRRALTIEEAQELLATCATDSPIDLRDRAMFVVGLETGMRRMSLAGMALEAIKNSRDGYPVAAVPIKGSGESLFPVPLSDTAIVALTPWRNWLRKQKITQGPVFRGLKRQIARGAGKLEYTVGEGLSLVSIYKIVERRAKKAGLDSIHPHIFRNTFITWRMQAGLTPYQIAAITGHKMANLPGLAGMGVYIDAARLGDEARKSTPAWLKNTVLPPR
ncbi:MAG: tyrosine-type recombinase/integrase [Tepidisphaeraceae bacterium]